MFVFLSGLLVIALSLYLYARHAYSYWNIRGVPSLKPSFPFGSFGNPLTSRKNAVELLMDVYNELKTQGHQHGGSYVFTSPFYIPIHLDYLKSVLSKDFHHFVNRGLYINEKVDPLSSHLFALEGERWRKMRKAVNPVFTAAKMKMAFDVVVKCSKGLENLGRLCCEQQVPIEAKAAFSNFTMDVVGAYGFGVECNSFSNPNSEFVRLGKKLFQLSNLFKLKFFIFFALPELARMLRMTVAPKDVSDFYMGVVKDTVKHREESTANSRKDFIQLLLDLKNNPNADPEVGSLTIEQIAAQAFVFFLAGFETSSTGMAFCLLELAQREDVQERVRCEIKQVLERSKGEITFDSLQEMKYLDMVLEGKDFISKKNNLIPRV